MITNEVFYQNAFWLAGVYILYAILLLVLVFKLTHRYYGPLVAVKRFLNILIEGEYSSRISLRKNDELKDIAAKLNELAQALEEKHGNSLSK